MTNLLEGDNPPSKWTLIKRQLNYFQIKVIVPLFLSALLGLGFLFFFAPKTPQPVWQMLSSMLTITGSLLSIGYFSDTFLVLLNIIKILAYSNNHRPASNSDQILNVSSKKADENANELVQASSIPKIDSALSKMPENTSQLVFVVFMTLYSSKSWFWRFVIVMILFILACLVLSSLGFSIQAVNNLVHGKFSS